MKTIFTVLILISTTTGFYDSKSDTFEHNLYCEIEEERIYIISGQYGFKCSSERCTYMCNNYYYGYCDCLRDFNRTVELNLKDKCNGEEECNFKTPEPYNQVCYNILTDFDGGMNNVSYARYKYSYIEYECLTATTALPTRRTTTTSEQAMHGETRHATDTRTIKSTKLNNYKSQTSTESGRTGAGLDTTEIDTTDINIAESLNQNQDVIVDTGAIVGIVMGCILLVIIVLIAVVFIFKRKTIESFITNRFEDSARVSNPVYEAPRDGYNNVTFKNNNSPSVNVVKSDDYNHLHDIKNDNSMTSGNTYIHMGQMMGHYNHLHANNNSLRVDEHSHGAYNNLGMVNSKTHNSDYNHLNGLNGTNNVSEEVHKANYNHLNGLNGTNNVSQEVHKANYNHLNDVHGEIPKADYNHLGENKTNKISNDDYSHIGDLTNETTNGDYHHIDNVTEHVFNDDDYNHIGDTKHEAIDEYELAHKGDLPVQDEQKPDNVQYEITDDERGDYSNISEQHSNYENFPISDHQTC